MCPKPAGSSKSHAIRSDIAWPNIICRSLKGDARCTTDVTGIVTLPEGVEMVMPGDNVTMEVALIVPVAMEEKLRFAIREGGRTVGAGVVASIIE